MLKKEIRPIQWSSNTLYLLDQTLLPHSETVVELQTWKQVVDAIKNMRVRGAPALGVTAGYAMALASIELTKTRINFQQFLSKLTEISYQINEARPTAVNIHWAVSRQLRIAKGYATSEESSNALVREAIMMEKEDIEINMRIGQHGSKLLHSGNILTHCNTGALATAGYGTALGVVRASWENGNNIHVFHTETRPFLQGARLTAWELSRLGIPSTMIVDSAAGLFLNNKTIQNVIVGADRIALSKENGIPFYVAAPISTIDLSMPTGDGIPIEERPAAEVTHLGNIRTTPDSISVRNPSFDITPAKYITAFITENGIVKQPFNRTLLQFAGKPRGQ